MREIESVRKGSFTSKILKMFEPNKVFEGSLHKLEEVGQVNVASEVSFNVYSWTASRKAALEAERKKALALMERQKHVFIC